MLSTEGNRPVWIDTDVALGGDRGDVDDGFALAAVFAAARRAETTLAGVSTVFGNTSARLSEAFARRLADVAGIDPAVVRGAERPEETTEAAQRIASLEDGGELLTLGPLTNVAAACRLDRTLPSRLSLRVVGGNLSSRGFLPPLWPHEFNLTADLVSARLVFSLEWKRLTIYPLDVVRRLRLTRGEIQRLRQSSPLGMYLALQSSRWLARSRWRHPGRGFPLWDLPATLDLAGLPSAVYEIRQLSAASSRILKTKQEFRCLTGFDAEAAWRRFLELVGN